MKTPPKPRPNPRPSSTKCSSCTWCNLQLPTPRDLRNHIRNCNNKPKEKEFSCPYCERTFKTSRGLDTHVRNCLVKRNHATVHPNKSQISKESPINPHSTGAKYGFRSHKATTPVQDDVKSKRSPKFILPSNNNKNLISDLNSQLEQQFHQQLPACQRKSMPFDTAGYRTVTIPLPYLYGEKF